LFFKVYRKDKLIKSTEDAVLIGVKSCSKGIIIEVDAIKAPTASFTVTPSAGEAPLEVRLDGSASSDPYCSITSYAWDFGDGNTETGTGPTAVHTYVTPGALTVSLTVTNDKGVTNTASKAITVIEPVVLAPPSGVTATAGDGQVVIRWDDVTGATSYNLYSSTSPGVSKQNGNRIEGVTSPFTHSGLINGTTYFYVVTAVNEKGESAESNQVSAVPVSAISPPPIDNTVATTLAAATSFLYSGANPIQIGVADGTIDPGRVAALRGQVLTPEGQPLSVVKVRVLNHPEFGSTLTRADGIFDMAVNGGNLLTVCYERDDHITAHRQIMVPWQDYVVLPNVVMIPADEQVSPIDLNSAAAVQVARGSQVSADDGDRQATLMFSQGVTAEMVLPDGSAQALESLQVRATEFTLGPTGPAAMPAKLPANSGYTYAVEFTVDEAIAAGSQDVRFSRPLIHYVENFLNFPVSTIVPVGSYDRQKAAWIPSDNGRVIQILSVSNGLAELDLDGSGVAADAGALAQLGVTEAERQQLASLYQPGQSIWRVPITHFSPWDCNWPFGSPDDAEAPNQPDPEGDDREDDPCVIFGSLIECQNQVLGEMVDIRDTRFNLHYRSDRVPRRRSRRRIRRPIANPRR
jgi:PKD repeat protein